MSQAWEWLPVVVAGAVTLLLLFTLFKRRWAAWQAKSSAATPSAPSKPKEAFSWAMLTKFSANLLKVLAVLCIIGIAMPVLAWIGKLALGNTVNTLTGNPPVNLGIWPEQESVSRVPNSLDQLEAAVNRTGIWSPWDGSAQPTLHHEKEWGWGVVLPPGVRTSFEVHGHKQEAYLVDSDAYDRPQSIELLRRVQNDGHVTVTYVYPLYSKEWPLKDTQPNKDTHVSVFYIQAGGGTFPIRSTPQAEVGQWLVEISKIDSASFTMPPGGWRYAWVVPIHDAQYQAKYCYEPITAAGFTIELLKDLGRAHGSEQAYLYWPAPIDLEVVSYCGLYYKVGDATPIPLVKSKTFSPAELGSGQRIELGLNVAEAGQQYINHPARVLVGIMR